MKFSAVIMVSVTFTYSIIVIDINTRIYISVRRGENIAGSDQLWPQYIEIDDGSMNLRSLSRLGQQHGASKHNLDCPHRLEEEGGRGEVVQIASAKVEEEEQKES